MSPRTPTPAAATSAKGPATPTTAKPKKPAKAKVRRKADPVKQWAGYLRRYRPGLQAYVLAGLTERYGEQRWEARLDPTSELILTILTQNTADVNAEKAYEALRAAYPSDRDPEVHVPGIGWGGEGLSTAAPPDWREMGWYKVTGTVEYREINGAQTTVFKAASLSPSKPPRQQMMY